MTGCAPAREPITKMSDAVSPHRSPSEIPGDSAALTWLSQHQELIAEQVTMAAGAIDEWASGDSFVEDFSNESFVSLSIAGEVGELTDNKLRLKLNGRLDLPSASRRYKLYFDSNDQDNESLEDQRGPATGSGDGVNDSVLGLIIGSNAFAGFQSDIGFGIRIGSTIDGFVKYQLTREDRLFDSSMSIWKQSVYYYHQSGSGYRTDWDVYSILDDNEFIQYSNSFKYTEEYSFWSSYYSISWNFRDSNINNWSLELGGASELDDEKISRQDNYFFRLQWKRRIYEDWLFLFVTPEINFPEAFNYSFTPSLFIELNMLFAVDTSHEARRRVKSMPRELRPK